MKSDSSCMIGLKSVLPTQCSKLAVKSNIMSVIAAKARLKMTR